MNRIFSIVWSRARRAWVVTSELAKRRSKRDSATRTRNAVSGFVLARRAIAHSPLAWPLRMGSLLPLLALTPSARAVDYYWDIDGATAGAGGATPTGTWSAGGTTLSTNVNGTTATGAVTTTTADRLFFSAGTDAAGAYTVTVSGTQNIGRLFFQEGTVNLTGGTLNGGAGTLTIDGTGDTIGSTIAGTNVSFNGGSVTLTGTNTFTGSALLGGALAQSTVILAAPGGNAISGSLLQLGGGNYSSAGFVTLGAAEQINDTATVTLSSGHYSGSSIFSLNGFSETLGGINLGHQGNGSSVTFRNSAATDATLTLAGSGTYTTVIGDRIGGRTLQNGGTGRLNVVVALTGAGSQTLAGIAPSYTGTTTVNSGTLRLWNTSAWASHAIVNGGTLNLHQTATGTPVTAGGNAATRTHSQTVGGAGGTLRKTGDGAVILSGNNTYQGATQIDQGTLRAGSATAFGNNSAVTLANVAGATMDLNNFNMAIGSLAGGGATGGNLTLGTATLTAGGNDTSASYAGAISGSGNLIKTGTQVQTLAGCNSSYSGTTAVNTGTLAVSCLSNGGANSSIGASAAAASNLVLNAGALRYVGTGGSTDRRFTLGGDFALESSGTGAIDFTDPNAIALTGAAARTLTLGGTNTNDNTLAALIGDAGAGATSLIKDGSGTWVLTGNNSYTGTTTVNGGTLRINGSQSAPALTTVGLGGTLGGTGTIGGDVTVASGGTLAPGNSPGTLTINGDLILDAGSTLNFEFGVANVIGGPLNDLLDVGGDLTLDGSIDVTVSPGGSFGAGLYRVINYAGALTDNTLDLGTMPAGSNVFVQTAIANQVNLVNTAGLTLNFWDGPPGPKNDGAIQGATGVWRLGGGSNDWTGSDGAINADYTQNSFAIFAGTPGVVTVDDVGGAVGVSGMQFAVDGYEIGGDALTLAGTSATVRVGDGTLAGAGMAATIDAELGGAAELVKADLGTLVLDGTNTYTGGTAIDAGTLQVSSDANLGAAAGALSFASGGTLRTTATFGSARNVTLDGVGTFLTDAGTTLMLSGVVDGAGSLTKTGNGTLVLSSSNTYAGGTAIDGGTLQISSDANLGAASGGLSFDGGTLRSTATFGSARDVTLTGAGTFLTDAGTTLTLSGVASGAGSLSKDGAGVLILDSSNTYAGGTTISAGTLQIGNGGVTGSIAGNVTNNGLLAFDRSDTVTFGGTISGSGALDHTGTGTTILTGDNSFTGATTVGAGALLVNGNQSAATGLTGVATGATLGGSGMIGGDVAIAAGAMLAPGSQDVGTLTVNGSLSLAGASLLDYEFGQSNTVGGPLNDLVAVGGNLVLDGTIDVTVSPGGSFDVGLYRIATYGGTLTDNTLDLGALPPGSDVRVQTAVANQVNLVNTAGLTLNFWDGAAGPKADGSVDGGDGTWQAGAGNNNWTETTGATNAPYSDGTFAIFAATPGIVTVDDGLGAVTVGGMQFASDGYVVTGDSLGLMGAESIVRVGDGSIVGAGTSATLAAALTGTSRLVKTDLGTLRLAGANSYSGGTRVTAGTLLVNGDSSAAGGLVEVLGGGTLGGSGTIGGNVTIGDSGTLAPGDGAGTLTIGGNLALASGSILEFALGQANVPGGPLNDLVTVRGDLVLDGTLDVSVPAGGNFGVGIYRLFEYAGVLTDNGLALGMLPAGNNAFVQTAVANQVNLVNAGSLGLDFWDGTDGIANDGEIQGGDGVWRLAAEEEYWTTATGAVNGPYANGAFAVFTGAPGTVTIDGSSGGVTASGMQFAVDGYELDGDALALVGAAAVVRVGDGTAGGAAMTATIHSELTGAAPFAKTDLGRLVLTGANTYAGGTTISAGTLQLGNGGATGSIVGDVQNDGTLAFSRSDTHSFDGTITGSGAVEHIGSGTTILTGTHSYTGGTTISAGTVQVDGFITGATNVGPAGTLSGVGSVGSVTTASGAVVRPGNAAAPFGALTLTGDYAGDGTVSLNTVLGDQTSPTSRLVIHGATAGASSPVAVNRAGGDGAQTSGDGIEIIQVDGASPAGSFRLAAPVQAGAYEYLLYQGGAADPNDWYLRSELASPPPPVGGVPPVGEAPRIPAFRPGVAGYALGHQIGLDYGFSALGNLRLRVGDQGRGAPAEHERPSDAWMRIYGHELTLAGERFEARDVRMTTLSFGTDLHTREARDGSAHFGVMASVGESRAAFFDPLRATAGLAMHTGTVEMDVKGGGVYWTLHDGGKFLDVSAQALNYRNRYRDQYLAAGRQDGWGGTVAAEIGSAVGLGATRWSIEPRLHVAYQRLDLDEFADEISTVASVDDDGLRARVAMQIFRKAGDWLGMSDASPYVSVGVQRDFRDAAAVTVGGTSFRDQLPETTRDLGVGFMGSIRSGLELHFDTGYQQSTDGERDGLHANFGFRMTF